jgi:protein-disulfide isomerase/uncharacterized membrane protein
VSHYLLFSDLSYQSFCALTKSINCDTVSQSPYAVLGRMPVAAWGAFGYALYLVLAAFAAGEQGRGGRIWALCLAAAWVFSAASTAFAYISSVKIRSYCILCIATYAVNFLLVYMAWLIRRRFPAEKLPSALGRDLRWLWEKRRLSVPLFGAWALALVSVYAMYPAYWNLVMPPPAASVPSGYTPEGNPWIGAEKPVVEIAEFSDYQCFQCRKMHFFLRHLVARYPDALRLVHFHYPMDSEFNPVLKQPFHIGSGKMALLAIHAAAAGRFWEMNDFLFDHAGESHAIDLVEAARATGLDAAELSAALNHVPYRVILQRDLRHGIRLGLHGTPSFIIDGKVYQGTIPAEILALLSGADPAAGAQTQANSARLK